MTAMHGTCQKNQKYTNNFLGLLLTRSSDQSGTDAEAAERFETRGAYLPLSHTHTPTQIFQMPFALFVGTSSFHSVHCVRNRFVTMHQ